ncbi:MAG: hypothetical protein HS115_03985 [Spirochaetales bacterium]|nr:hypothetical protein [Spirochaetales bacterium]
MRVLCYFLLLSATGALSASPLGPGMRFWYTLETEHFRIHYPSGQRDAAVRLAPLAEKTHKRLEARYRGGGKKTDVVLVFDSDLVNAFASTAYGLDQVVLYLNHPELGQFSRYDSWLELLFVHEYTHIVTTRYYDLGDLSGLFRILFGIPWNFLAPQGFIEGIAVFEESQAGKGRMKDPLTNMIARTAVLDNSFPDRGEIMSGSHRFPFGSHVYLYGGRFQGFLADRYGADRLAAFWRTEEFPFALDERLRTLRVRPYRLEYQDYADGEIAEARRVIDEVSARGVTPYRRLTEDGYSKTDLVFHQGDLFYFASPGNARPGIFALNPATLERERLRRTPESAGFAMAGDIAIYSDPYFFSPGFYGYRNELYLEGWWDRRLLRGTSASHPALNADGSVVYYVERDEKERRLIRADLTDRKISSPAVVRRVPLGGILESIAVAPDGGGFAFVERPGTRGFAHLVYCTAELNCKIIVGGEATKTHPRFSPNGQEIYFTSDADGIYNLYSYQLTSGAILRRTRTLTGFFEPAPAPDRLYATAFFRSGYDIISFAYEDLLREPADFFANTENQPPDTADLDVAVRDSSYNGVLRLRPWISGILVSDLGLVLAAGAGLRDPLGRHMLLGGVSLFGTGLAMYEYSRFNPALLLTYSTNAVNKDLAREYPGCLEEGTAYRLFCDYKLSRDEGQFLEAHSVYQEAASGSLRYAKDSRTVSFQSLLGYSGERLRNARRIQTMDYAVRDLDRVGPLLTLVAGDTAFYPESISQEHGYILFLNSQYFGPGSRTVVDEYRLSDLSFFDEKLDLPPLALRPKNRRALSYGIAEAGAAAFLPSFADHHVNYLSVYAYTTYGPDRYTEKVSLYRFVRGQNWRRAPRNIGAEVLTYEYRMPLLFASRTLGDSSFMLRSISMGAFVDYGASFDRYPYREDWVGGYGLTMAIGLNFLHLVLPDMKFTLARGTGPAGETQFLLSFSAGLSGDVIGHDGRTAPAYREPYRRALPGFQHVPGYFRERSAGGVLE